MSCRGLRRPRNPCNNLQSEVVLWWGPQVSKLVLVFFLATLFVGQSAPDRRVSGTAVSSSRDPQLQIHLPEAAQYAGADRWVLYGVADCEVHVFVEPDAHETVQRLYWIQFEGYLPSKPDLAHQYNSPRHSTIGGLDFYVDTWPVSNSQKYHPDSDHAHIEALIRAKGYKMPAGMMYVRLVHLLDEKKRKELMIIYGEDLAPTDFTAPELQEGGKAHGRWPALESGLIARAEKAITLNPR
jgi:hypothetical protein